MDLRSGRTILPGRGHGRPITADNVGIDSDSSDSDVYITIEDDSQLDTSVGAASVSYPSDNEFDDSREVSDDEGSADDEYFSDDDRMYRGELELFDDLEDVHVEPNTQDTDSDTDLDEINRNDGVEVEVQVAQVMQLDPDTDGNESVWSTQSNGPSRAASFANIAHAAQLNLDTDGNESVWSTAAIRNSWAPSVALSVREIPDAQNANSHEQEAAVTSPPRKQAKMESKNKTEESPSKSKLDTSDGESDGLTCTICYDPFTNSGDHRISCLRCGHVYGKTCIEKWLRLHGRCPQCNCKATKKDIRVLYVRSLQAIDNTELTAAKKELETVNITLSRQNLENAKLRIQIENFKQQVKRFEEQIFSRHSIMEHQSSSAGSSAPATGTTNVPSSSIRPSDARKELKFNFMKQLDIREGACRVGAYNEFLNMLVISHDMKNSLYPNGCGGIKEINMLEARALVSLPIHQKQIRDMQFSLCQNDTLLSVGMDKKAILFSVTGNVGVQSFVTDYPLWSCAWDEVHQYMFYVGTSNGQIITYDIRSPQQSISSHVIDTQDHSPVNRLRFVRPAYQANSFNLSGLLVQQLNSLNFCEIRGAHGTELRSHQLPIEGPFTNVDYEAISGHFLVSTRPSTRIISAPNGASHHLCHLNQYYSESMERNVVSSNQIRTYQGSTREVQKLCRSSIFSPEPNYVYVGANGSANAVKYWDISLPEHHNKSINPSPEFTLDFVHGKLNGSDFSALVNERGVRIYKKLLS